MFIGSSSDVNECAVSNGGCEQVCTDVSLGNNCSCYSGYSLDANLKNCTGKRVQYSRCTWDYMPNMASDSSCA